MHLLRIYDRNKRKGAYKKMTIFRIVSFAFFAINSVLHLFWKKHGSLTKSLILPSIMLCYFSIAETISPVWVIAAIASWLGDVFLIKPGVKWFTAGGLFFMLSHMVYGLSYIPKIDFSSLNFILVAVISVIYCAAAAITIFLIRKSAPERMAPLLYIYLLTNAFMNILALMTMLSSLNPFGILIYIGAVLFFISDNFLFIECFHEKKPNYFRTVMSTYITGEFLIALGSALL